MRSSEHRGLQGSRLRPCELRGLAAASCPLSTARTSSNRHVLQARYAHPSRPPVHSGPTVFDVRQPKLTQFCSTGLRTHNVTLPMTVKFVVACSVGFAKPRCAVPTICADHWLRVKAALCRLRQPSCRPTSISRRPRRTVARRRLQSSNFRRKGTLCSPFWMNIVYIANRKRSSSRARRSLLSRALDSLDRSRRQDSTSSSDQQPERRDRTTSSLRHRRSTSNFSTRGTRSAFTRPARAARSVVHPPPRPPSLDSRLRAACSLVVL